MRFYLFFFILTLINPLLAYSTPTNSSPKASFEIVESQFVLDKTTINNAFLVKSEHGGFSGLQIEIKESAAKDFTRYTKEGVGKTINVILDKKIISSAKIYSPLPNVFLIVDITEKDAQHFVNLLKQDTSKG